MSSDDAASSVLSNIDKAWDLAIESSEQAQEFASNAALLAKTKFFTGDTQINLDLDSNAGNTQTFIDDKIAAIEGNAQKTLDNTIPTAYNKLFKNLINSGSDVTSAFGPGRAGALDAMSLVSGMSQAFKTFNFDTNTNNLSSFLSSGMLTGGTGNLPYGVPLIIEDALVARMTDRFDQEALAEEEAVVNQYASRGFPVPPGLLTKRFCKIREELQEKKSAAFRDIAIEQAKRGFDASQNYIQQFQSLQKQTADAFNSYMGTVVTARAGAADDVKALVTSVAALQESIAKLYGFAMDERKVLLEQAIAEGQLASQITGHEISAYKANVDISANTAMAAAQAMGNIAAAAVSSQNSMSRISADTTKTI